MSGHSKWANIKNKKAKTDAVRGKVFTKIGRELAVAAKGNPDPYTNSKLADVIAKAKANNMPNDTIDRGIKKAAGDVELMRRMGQDLGMEILVNEPVYIDDMVVSSTLVRRLITEGDMERASVCLGRNFYCTGKVIPGKQLGGRIGFPTANVVFEAYRIAPPNGVYYTLAEIDGIKYPGITDVGVKPTVGEFEKSIETHVYGLNRDLYGKNIRIEFLKWERPEMKFGSVEELRERIASDCEKGRQYHRAHGFPEL